VKHAVPQRGERLVDAAEDAWRRGLADALVLSGRATGSAPDAGVVHEVRAALGARVPLFLGSGVSSLNAAALLAEADGAIVGTSLKERGDVGAPVDEARVRALVEAFARLGAAPGRRQRDGS
jgi:predicted TIM-barrel enzyme